jgi:nicotinamide riboside transporter PnuC
MFFQDFFLIPIVIAVVFVLAVAIIRIIMWKNHKFDQWVNDVWPNSKQRSAIITTLVIIAFLWIAIGKY